MKKNGRKKNVVFEYLHQTNLKSTLEGKSLYSSRMY